MAETGAGSAPAGRIRWRRRLFLGGLVVVAGLVSLHAFGGRDTGMGAIVVGGLALLGFAIVRLPHLRRHFARPGGGGRGPGSLNFPSQVAARERAKRFSLFRRRGAASAAGGGGRGSGGSLHVPRLPRLFRGRRRGSGGAGGSWGTAGSSSRRRSGLFRGRHRGSGAGIAFGSAGSSSRRRPGIFRGRRRGSGSAGGSWGPAGAPSRRHSGLFRRFGGSRRAGGGTVSRRGHLPVWRRGASAGGRRRAAAGGGGTGTRRRSMPWRRHPRPAAPPGNPPSWRRPVARARWRRAHPLNPGHRRWYAPWRRTGAAAGAGGGVRTRRRFVHRIIGTPAQRHTRKLVRISRRARVRAARRRAAANPYARTSRWRARLHHRRWWRQQQHPMGRRARIARWWRTRRGWHIRRGLHRGLGFVPRRVRTRRPPRPLLAGLRTSPGLRRFAASPLGRLVTWIDRRRADRWLRRQRRHAPGGVARPRVPQPRPQVPGWQVPRITPHGISSREGGHGMDTRAMADEIRTMGSYEFADPQDVHDTLTGMNEMVQAMQDVLNGWGLSLAETGVHPRYPEATQEAAQQMAGIADTLGEVTSGGVMRGPGG